MTPRLSDCDELVFAVGVEDTAIGEKLRGGGVALDEYELTGHRQQWREDLLRAGDTGATATPARIAPSISSACSMLFSDKIITGALSGPNPLRMSQVATAAVSREAAA